VVVCLTTVACLVGCGGSDDQPEAAPTTAAPTTGSPSTASPTADPAGLSITCSGSGETTVVFMAGLGAPGDVHAAQAGRAGATSRTCYYDRAGLGASPALAADAPDPSPGRAAADLHAALAAQDIPPPYVVLGWSYGGLVAQAFSSAYADDVTGLVLEDSSVLEQFTDPDQMEFFADAGILWEEGGRDIDTAALVDEISAVDLSGVPTVVLSQDVDGDWAGWWYGDHDRIARQSPDSVHVIGRGSGHEMHVDVPDLVAAAVTAVVTAAEGGAPVAPCDERFTAVGGRCRDL